MPKLTVITSVYHTRHDYLAIAINSILNQTYTDFDYLITIDDPKSTDDYEYIQNTFKDPRIKVFMNEKNLGPGESLNKLTRLATTAYVAVMDSDDYSYPTRLEKEMKYLEENDVDLVSTDLDCIDENGKLLYCYNSPVTEKRLYEDFEVPHAPMIFKKELFDTINGYRDIKMHDCDFLVRARLAGYSFGIVAEPLYSYRLLETSFLHTTYFYQQNQRICVLNAYKEGRVASLEEIEHYCQEHAVDKKTEQDYVKAANYYRKSTAARYHHKPIQRYWYFFLCLCSSKLRRERFINRILKK
ncbi:MAG: glycosyltransferase [Erysipelotrichaceae bacterium]|nr:glycosyltransferase [Erysipelotrichaceae bacterium]